MAANPAPIIIGALTSALTPSLARGAVVGGLSGRVLGDEERNTAANVAAGAVIGGLADRVGGRAIFPYVVESIRKGSLSGSRALTALGVLGIPALALGAGLLGGFGTRSLVKRAPEEVGGVSIPEVDSSRAMTGAALSGGGIMALPIAARRALGYSTLYHGTSDSVARRILQEGFDPGMGGAGHGSSAAVASSEFINNSGGYTHFAADKGIARMFANLTGHTVGNPRAAQPTLVPAGGTIAPDRFSRYLASMFTPTSKGRVLSAHIPHTFSSAEDISKALRQAVTDGAFITDPDFSEFAIKTSRKVGKDMVGLRGLLNAIKESPAYLKARPGRAAVGALGVLAALGLLGYGGHRMYSAVGKRGE